MPVVVPILFGAGFTVLTCVSLGRLLLRALRLKFHWEEAVVFAFVIGAACLSTIVFAAAALGLVYRAVFVGIGCAAMAGAMWRGLPEVEPAEQPGLRRPWKLLLGAAFVAFTALYWFNAMAPEHSPDGSAYHLGLVSRYLREHGFRRITTDMYANLSQGVEMLFLFAFAFGKHSAAALAHFAFLVALASLIYLYGRRFGMGLAAASAALLVYSSPLAGIDGVSAYNDVAVACLMFAVFYLLEIWAETRNPALLPAIGLLAGFCYAAKYTAFLALPFALVFIGAKLWRARQPLLRPLLIVGIFSFVMSAPWMAKNYLWLQNPFSPFANRLFPNPYIRVSFEKEYVEILRNYGNLKSRWDIPLELTIRGGLAGVAGPAFLLAPMGLLAWRRSAGRRWLAAGVVFAVPWLANAGARFVLPTLPFVSLAMSLSLGRWAPVLALAHGVSAWPAVLERYTSPSGWTLKNMPVRAALRLETEEKYLESALWFYPIVRMIDQLTPAEAKVFSFHGLPQAYSSRDILVAYQSAFNNTISDILLTPVYVGSQALWRSRFSFSPESVRKLRVVQTAGPAKATWSISELWILNGRRQLAREPGWRLTADANPWEVAQAFDGSLVTRWHSDKRLTPGMYVEVDFGKLQTVDEVLLAVPSDDRESIRLRLEGSAGSGTWKTLGENPEHFQVPAPERLGAAAMQEAKLRGINYLLIADSDDGAREYRWNAPAWGLRPVGESRGMRLYRLE